jgi:hypothetical protein
MPDYNGDFNFKMLNLSLDLSSSGSTNNGNSNTDELNLTEDRGVDAVIQSNTFKDDSSMIPFSCEKFF